MQLASETTFEFGEARLQLRADLKFHSRTIGNDIRYMVEDEISGRYFQLALPQYTFLSMLDGRRTVSSALMKTATVLRDRAIDQQQAASLCLWAIQSGLVESELSNSEIQRLEKRDNELLRNSLSWFNPITLRFPLFCPDRLIATAAKYTGWIVSWFGAVLWLLVCGYGFGCLLPEFDRFVGDRVAVFDPQDMVWLGVSWLVLKLVHESAHGLTCRRFGGQVKQFGLLLLLLIPLPYVDVTSAWRFENKWHRILVGAAGMLAEIFIAAVAAIVWVNSDPGPLQYHAGNVIITATLHTLLFNINPLMRFDGYYMLSDWLNLPNLATHARSHVKSTFAGLYFGTAKPPMSEHGWRGLVVRIYGYLSIGWFLMISIGLSVAAMHLLPGFGILMAVVSVILWFVIPTVMLAKYVIVGTPTQQPNRVRFACAAMCTVAIAVAFLVWCPAPSVVTAPVVIDYDQLSIVRAEAAGFAKELVVQTGESVTAGQTLAVLQNPQLVAERDTLDVEIQISELRVKSLLHAGRIAELLLEQENLAALNARQHELSELMSHLEIRAPQAGRIVTRELDNKQGLWFQPGDELLSIAATDDLQATGLARQDDIDWLKSADEIELQIYGDDQSAQLVGTLLQSSPRARDDVPHPAFAGSNGGPLAVIPRSQMEDSPDSESETDELMLTVPRFVVDIQLPVEQRQSLHAGQTGTLFVRARSASMGRYLLTRLTKLTNESLNGL